MSWISGHSTAPFRAGNASRLLRSPFRSRANNTFRLALTATPAYPNAGKWLNTLLLVQLRDHPRSPFRRGGQAVVPHQRRPDEGMVVTCQKQFPIGGGVRQFLRATNKMPQRPLSSRTVIEPRKHNGFSPSETILSSP